jgi:hypothetical protein
MDILNAIGNTSIVRLSKVAQVSDTLYSLSLLLVGAYDRLASDDKLIKCVGQS